MRVLTYQGGVAHTSARHPESFTVLAPEPLQQACLTHGGRPVGTDKPRFRLALVASRYQLVGGQEVADLDEHGNLRSRGPEELFIPRYHVPEHQHGMYVLEMWRPVEWFYRQRGDVVAVEYGATGEGHRKMEPIWPEGAYRGLDWKFGQPFVLPRDVAMESSGGLSVRWALWAALKSLEYEFDYEQELKWSREEAAREKEKDINESIEISRDKGRSDMFLEPTMSMTG